jgi:hypothetical protein
MNPITTVFWKGGKIHELDRSQSDRSLGYRSLGYRSLGYRSRLDD